MRDWDMRRASMVVAAVRSPRRSWCRLLTGVPASGRCDPIGRALAAVTPSIRAGGPGSATDGGVGWRHGAS
jgi:hypothetical protein